jgi:hypothetical protein
MIKRFGLVQERVAVGGISRDRPSVPENRIKLATPAIDWRVARRGRGSLTRTIGDTFV